jgi:hypothetical protein
MEAKLRAELRAELERQARSAQEKTKTCAPAAPDEYSLTLTVNGIPCKAVGQFDPATAAPKSCHRMGMDTPIFVDVASNVSHPPLQVTAVMRGFSTSAYSVQIEVGGVPPKTCKGSETANCSLNVPALIVSDKYPSRDIDATMIWIPQGGVRQRDKKDQQLIDGLDTGIRLTYRRPKGQ